MNCRITGQTKVIGIFGYPVEHSFSPVMHNAALAHLGLDYVYVPFAVKPDNLGQAVEGIRALQLTGVNVTIPHKSAVLEYLDELSTEARLIGAVNTIVNKDGWLYGYNTDAAGFVKSLEEDGGVTPRGKSVFILGAGGAARAVSIQLALAGAAQIIFCAPTASKVIGLKAAITTHTDTAVHEVRWGSEELTQSLGSTDILINATPLGMYPHTGEMPPVSVESLSDKALVCDLIYNPRETQLLQLAKQRGLATLNGMGMLLHQGAIALKLWTGHEPPLEIMREALETGISRN